MSIISTLIILALNITICLYAYIIGWGKGYERGLTEGVFTSKPEIHECTDDETPEVMDE